MDFRTFGLFDVRETAYWVGMMAAVALFLGRAALPLAVGLALAASWAAGLVAGRQADAALAREAAASASLYEAVLRSALERHRALPMVLAGDGALAAALESGGAAALRALDGRLAGLEATTAAAAIYVIDADGRTVAASNAGTPLSFVGRDFTFRDYFAEAMAGGRGEQFALGTTTNQPGLYLSARVEGPAGPLGVVVTKIDFSGLEAEWARAGAPVFVTDGDGRVIITTVEDWRFRKEADLGVRAVADNPVHVEAARPGGGTAEYVRAATATAMAGWTLNLLQPASGAVDAAVTAASTVTLLVAAALILGGWLLMQRRTRAARAAAARAEAQAELEARVAARTRELSAANAQLTGMIEARRKAEAALLLLHQELEQANRLTTLGQIAAGVTHEINQPVAAIASWAHNARALLARGDMAEAEAALGTIEGLTERIGRITGELRDFARKSDGPAQAVRLEDAVTGARMLVRGRGDAVHIDSSGVGEGVRVMADRIRLEQVLVNLLQNAMDAGATRIGIEAATSAGRVRISVADDGPGLPRAIRAKLFTPFQTSKPRGLGLGLVISRDICRAMDGELRLATSGKSGTRFDIELPAATGLEAAAA